MKRCKYCNHKLTVSKGTYIAKRVHYSSFEGPSGYTFSYYHIDCKKLYEKISTHTDLRKSLDIIKNLEDKDV